MSEFRQDLAISEYEALQNEKQDRMKARDQIWSLLVGLVGAFGFVSFQMNLSGYVGLYPILAACIAMYAGHNEQVLDQIKLYLLKFEDLHDYYGYEHFNQRRRQQHRRSGSQLKALCAVQLITELVASLLAVFYLVAHASLLVVVCVAIVESTAMVATVLFLRDPGRFWHGRGRVA